MRGRPGSARRAGRSRCASGAARRPAREGARARRSARGGARARRSTRARRRSRRRYASAWETGSDTRATTAAHGALKRRTRAERSVRPPSRRNEVPRRSASRAVARARRLSASSPSDSTGTRFPSSARHKDASLAIPSHRSRRSWISQATRGGSSIRSGARGRRAVKIEAGCLDRLSSHLRERLDGDRRVGVGQLTLGGERDQGARDVHPDGEPVGGVVVAAAVEGDEPGAVRGLEERMGAGRRLGQERPVRALEARGAAPGPVDAGRLCMRASERGLPQRTSSASGRPSVPGQKVVGSPVRLQSCPSFTLSATTPARTLEPTRPCARSRPRSPRRRLRCRPISRRSASLPVRGRPRPLRRGRRSPRAGAPG